MQIHIVKPKETLRDIATRYARAPHTLAVANGLSPTAHLTEGDALLIPGHLSCRSAARPAFLLCGKADAHTYGSALMRTSPLLSLLSYKLSTGRNSLCPVKRPRCFPTPTLLDVTDVPSLCHVENLCEILTSGGFTGISVPLSLVPHCGINVPDLKKKLSEQTLTFGISCNGEELLCHPHRYDDILSYVDLIDILPTRERSLEEFLSDMSVILSRKIRGRTLVSLSSGDGTPLSALKKKGTRARCPINEAKLPRSSRDCAEGIQRITADGYGGITIPVGGISPFLYSLITEACQVIPASQRIGRHSRM